MIETVEGIVLGGFKYSDSSKIIRIFTRQHGKLSFIANGAFSKKSKFGATLEPISYGSFSYYVKNSSLNTLSSGEFIKYYSLIYKSQEKLATSLVIIELLNNTQIEFAKNEPIFNLSLNFFSKINESDEKDFFIFLVHYLLEFSNLSGYKLNIYVPDNNLQQTFYYFSPEEGQFIFKNFGSTKPLRLSNEATMYLKNICSEEDISSTFNNREIRLEILIFLIDYLSYHFSRNITIHSLNLLYI